MKGISPTQRTLKALKEQGRLCAIAEKWNPFGGPFGVRKDLFGFIDVIVLDPQRGIGAIQSTGTAFKQHLDKLLNSDCTEAVIEWLRSGGFVELWGWRKVKLRRGAKAMRWQPRVKEITLNDLEVSHETQN